MALKSFTLRVDDEIYEQYAYLAAIRGQNVTKMLRFHMEDAVNDRLSNNDRQKIDAQIKDAVTEYASQAVIEKISEQVAKRLGLAFQAKEISEVSQQPIIEIKPEDWKMQKILVRDDVPEISEMSARGGGSINKKTSEVSEVSFLGKNENSQPEDEKMKKDYNPSDRSDEHTKKSSDLEAKTSESDSDRSSGSPSAKLYTDAEVAEQEALNKTTIFRYRTHKRIPQDLNFWARWKVSESNSKRWEAL